MIRLKRLTVQSGPFKLGDVTFLIPTGQYGVLMGRSGSGKTTILEAVCGLRRKVSGSIILMGREVVHRKPADRNIGYVPQDSALFSEMRVEQHLSFALRIRKLDSKKIKQRVDALADMLNLQHLLRRRPGSLSGGEAQRVALGRALSHAPPVLCLDEPLSSLDEGARDAMCDLLKSVQAKTGVTILHVTHSETEARRLADCVFRLKNGKVRKE